MGNSTGPFITYYENIETKTPARRMLIVSSMLARSVIYFCCYVAASVRHPGWRFFNGMYFDILRWEPGKQAIQRTHVLKAAVKNDQNDQTCILNHLDSFRSNKFSKSKVKLLKVSKSAVCGKASPEQWQLRGCKFTNPISVSRVEVELCSY